MQKRERRLLPQIEQIGLELYVRSDQSGLIVPIQHVFNIVPIQLALWGPSLSSSAAKFCLEISEPQW